ncbi:hypothetical protein [Parabacteroides sp.]|uniref:fimbrillin family protein n=1 Tax=Parabacteroides sp. TaxID=1869337 RepID=UPI00307FD7EA
MKQVKNLSLLIMASLMLSSCGEEENLQSPIDNTEKVELGITAGVALTKSAINGGDQTGATPEMKAIAVYASATEYKTDNYGLYTPSADGWKNTGADKIYLSSAVATIYAYHPAYQPDGTTHAMATSGTALKLDLKGAAVANTATIPVSIFAGNTSATDDNTITVPQNYKASDKKILSAPGEVDYMWAEKKDGNGANAQACNGKASNKSITSSVALNMKHALSMVSFRIYNNGHYNKDGHLTKIELANNDDATNGNKALNDGGLANDASKLTMKIADGTITTDASNKAAVTYTRIIKTATGGVANDYYALPKQGASGYDGSETAAKDAAATFSILVLPDASAVAKNTIKVTFTIDEDDYSVNLAADATTTQWKAGENNIYTVTLSGQELTLNSVTVAAWGDGPKKDLDVK